MLILRSRLYSKMEDEDYIGREEGRKRAVKHAKGQGTAVGTIAGALAGATLGSNSGRKAMGVGAALGGVVGGITGRYIGKKYKKSTEDDANRKISRYETASEKDRKYLREKEERDLDRAMQERQARAQERIAWNTRRW